MKFIDNFLSTLGIKKESDSPSINVAPQPKVEFAEQRDNTNPGAKETTESSPQQAISPKVKIYNLIIVDESGSMHELKNATLSGINETISTIKEAQESHASVQEHFLTLVTFDYKDERNPWIRTIIDTKPINDISGFADYHPYGSTPLYDAMGESIMNLRNKIASEEDAIGVVTILTDGLENSSRIWTAQTVRKLIEQLKEEGWTFSYMGSEHDVREVAELLSIDNVMEFEHDSAGASNIWQREKAAKCSYFNLVASEYDPGEDWESKKERRRRYNKEYYRFRMTPSRIDALEPNEIYVFGSRKDGFHNAGTAKIAEQYFGAKIGQGEGLQGQSYAIPTTTSLEQIKQAVHRFCKYAKEHQEFRFLVTRVGCGAAGYNPSEIAPLFREAIELENVFLPQEFWKILGLKLFNN